ncbi:glycosyltransferase family 4 protein [Ferrovum myxofaciens]|uniref:glycosyltransferase family 4 protein n=1 Tax=Ferrovum myxofaciens TaxID=416213 RepID=UPI003EC0ABAC
MKVLNCLHRAHFGGAQWRVVWVGEELRDHGVDTWILFPKNKDTDYEHFLQQRNFPYIRLRMPVLRAASRILPNLEFLLDLPFQLRRVMRVLRDGDFDLVHVNGLTNVVPVIAGILVGRPVVWHWNDTFTPVWFARIVMPLLRFRCWFVVASNAVWKAYNPVYYNERYLGVLLPPIPPVNIKIEESTQKLNVNGRVIGFVGHLVAAKGAMEFVQVIAGLIAADHDVTGVMVGGVLSGHEAFAQELKEKIETKGIGSRILQLGYRLDVIALMRQFDVLLFPSHHEAAPIVVLQALSIGLPIVATPVGNVPEFLVDMQMSLVPIGDVSAMVNAVSKLLLIDDAARQVYMVSAKTLVEESCSIAAVSARHLEVYQSACRSNE